MIEKGIYQHYSGKLYHVLTFAKDEETLEDLVIYQALYGNYVIWARKVEVFTQDVTHQGTLQPRFKFVKKPVQKLDPR